MGIIFKRREIFWSIGIIFKRREIFWSNLYTLFSFMHAFTKTHGVYMYGCSHFIASTAEALATELNMGRRSSLSTSDRCQALGMLRAGQSSRQVAAVFGVAPSTMSRLLQRFNAHNQSMIGDVLVILGVKDK